RARPDAPRTTSSGSASVSASTSRELLRRAGELFDAAAHRLELRDAEPVELLAAFPELRQLVDVRVAALEALDDRVELALRLLEARLAHSTVASKPPSARSTSIRSPYSTCARERTTSSPRRTMA